ncbi:MAG: hypothetical protein WKF47_15190 [Geodermatophilaceae bacterium]
MTLLRGALGLARSCHPGPTVAVTAVAAVLCAAVGHDAASGTAVTSAVLAGQLSIGWGNDWLDRDRDRRTGRADKPLAAGSMPRDDGARRGPAGRRGVRAAVAG